MHDHNPQKKANLVEALLKNARTSLLELPGSNTEEVKDSLSECEEHLKHDAFGPALDVLANVGHAHKPRAKFWDSLAQAAEQMELPEKAAEFRFESPRVF